MKYLKIFENFEDIHEICKKYRIKNYTINNDGSIDVYGDVMLKGYSLVEIPINFHHVSGYFDCEYNNLTTLKGSPKSVGGNFYCDWNYLTKLEGGPQSVGGSFWCEYNYITSFEGSPNHVGDNFHCVSNPIENIWKLFQDYSKVELLNDLDPIRDGDILMDRFNTFLSMIGEDEVLSVKGYNCIN